MIITNLRISAEPDRIRHFFKIILPSKNGGNDFRFRRNQFQTPDIKLLRPWIPYGLDIAGIRSTSFQGIKKGMYLIV